MVMTTGSRETAILRKPNVIPEDLFRLSPAPTENMAAYKCPVSTPANIKRSQHQGKIPESLAFVSLDVSHLQTNKQKYGNKIPIKHKGGIYRSPRRRNFDYYYVDKRFQNRIADQSNSYWLKTLCAQPVNEIFSKYNHPVLTPPREASGRTRLFATPGERSIIEGWESNSLKRGSSATSRASRISGISRISQTSENRTISPNLTIVSKSIPIIGTSDNGSPRADSRVDSVPHPPSLGNTEENSRAPSRASITQKETTEFSPLELNVNINEAFYDQFQRKKPKFPGIKTGRNNIVTERKYLTNTSTYKLTRHTSPIPAVSNSGVSNRKIRIVSPKTDKNCMLCKLDEKTDDQKE